MSARNWRLLDWLSKCLDIRYDGMDESAEAFDFSVRSPKSLPLLPIVDESFHIIGSSFTVGTVH